MIAKYGMISFQHLIAVEVTGVGYCLLQASVIARMGCEQAMISAALT